MLNWRHIAVFLSFVLSASTAFGAQERIQCKLPEHTGPTFHNEMAYNCQDLIGKTFERWWYGTTYITHEITTCNRGILLGAYRCLCGTRRLDRVVETRTSVCYSLGGEVID